MQKIHVRLSKLKDIFRKIWLQTNMAAEVTPSEAVINDQMPPVKKLKTCDDDTQERQACIP